MHESDARSISAVPKGEQVKMTSFLVWNMEFNPVMILAPFSSSEFL